MNRMLAAIAGLVFLSTCAAQTASDLLKRDYRKRLEAELVETGQRHVDLGWGIRNSGLIPQCTYQLVLAVELSEGKHRGASMVLNIVRTYKDAFWKKKRKKPRSGALKAYEKKAAALVKKDMLGQVKLARAALTHARRRRLWTAPCRPGVGIRRAPKPVARACSLNRAA